MFMIVSEITDKFRRKIRLTSERHQHILSRIEMKNQRNKIINTLKNPSEVRRSIKDAKVWLFYKKYKGTPVTQKYMLVAVKLLNNEGFIITAFFTDTIKKGELVWKKD